MLKVGVIGAGYIGLVHVETLMRMPGVEVVAVADSNEAQLASVARLHPGLRVTTDYRTLLRDREIAAIHNCTPNHAHYTVNRAVLNADKHLLSEKPLALSSDQAKRLLDLAEARGLKHAVHFCYRYYPTVQEIAARVRSGEIGRVREVLGHYLQDWLMYDTDYSWRLDPKVSGRSNTVADIGSHWFDLAQFLSGAKIVEVMADLNTFVPKRRRPKGAALTFAGKRTGPNGNRGHQARGLRVHPAPLRQRRPGRHHGLPALRGSEVHHRRPALRGQGGPGLEPRETGASVEGRARPRL